MSTAQMSSPLCGEVVRRWGASLVVVLVTWPWFKITRSVTKNLRVAEQGDVTIHSLTRRIVRRNKDSAVIQLIQIVNLVFLNRLQLGASSENC
ncbi:hypothetical protein TNCV_1074111 [Trichonephila clavipes]|uniref:Uncharacterized protein n=1 Tax=Trichonephila clavipes TaxID=2585209 RepID=A0A8X6T0H4_TRICX|nr:hypothetical protein TNCV_1074111 [Trichonephila clavipes]